jgi:hypothetical protein
MSLFRHFALNHHNKATLQMLKSYCFALVAWTVNHANKKVLKVALHLKKRPWLNGILAQIEILKKTISVFLCIIPVENHLSITFLTSL